MARVQRVHPRRANQLAHNSSPARVRPRRQHLGVAPSIQREPRFSDRHSRCPNRIDQATSAGNHQGSGGCLVSPRCGNDWLAIYGTSVLQRQQTILSGFRHTEVDCSVLQEPSAERRPYLLGRRHFGKRDQQVNRAAKG